MIRFCWIVLCYFVFVSISFSQTVWQPVHDGEGGPSPRRGVVGIYDSTHERLVLQGGESPRVQFFEETWEYNLQDNQWSSLAIQNPSARCHHTFLIEPSGLFGLLFGGFPRTNELWQWDMENDVWTDMALAHSPQPRCLHSSVICKSRNQMIVYGGLNGSFTPDLNDTWIFEIDSNIWNLVESAENPGMRYGHVAAIDQARNRMVIFGGFMNVSQNVNQNMNDMWEFDLDAHEWKRMDVAGLVPSPRQFARGTAVPNGKGMIVFGGRTNDGFTNELWFFRFEDNSWYEISVNGDQPEGRFRHMLIMDEEANRIWTGFGEGALREHYSDLWSLTLNELGNEDLNLSTQIQAWGIH